MKYVSKFLLRFDNSKFAGVSFVIRFFQLPKIPASDRTTENIQLYWNKGVTSSFEFLSELPGLVSTWTRNGVNAVLENPEVKKLLK